MFGGGDIARQTRRFPLNIKALNEVTDTINKLRRIAFNPNDFTVACGDGGYLVSLANHPTPKQLEPFELIWGIKGNYDEDNTLYIRAIAGNICLYVGGKRLQSGIACSNTSSGGSGIGNTQADWDNLGTPNGNANVYVLANISGAGNSVNIDNAWIATYPYGVSPGAILTAPNIVWWKIGSIIETEINGESYYKLQQSHTGDITDQIVILDGEREDMLPQSLNYDGWKAQIFDFSNAENTTVLGKGNGKVEYLRTDTLPAPCGNYADIGTWGSVARGDHKHYIEWASQSDSAQYAATAGNANYAAYAGALLHPEDLCHSTLDCLDSDDHEQYWLVGGGAGRNKGSSIGNSGGNTVIDLDTPALVGNWSANVFSANVVNANVVNANVATANNLEAVNITTDNFAGSNVYGSNITTDNILYAGGYGILYGGDGSTTDDVVIPLAAGGNITGRFIGGIFIQSS